MSYASRPGRSLHLTEQSVNTTYSCGVVRDKSFRDKIRSRCHRTGEHAEVPDQPVDVLLIVLHRDEPLFDLAPGREEHATVVLEQPVGVAVAVVDAQEAAVVP